jgi:hypothetical protein
MPPPTFSEIDLLGRWQNTFTQYHTEILILTPDHQFTQIFDTGQPARHYEGTGKWRVEQRASGCVYLHLEGMRYFYGAEAFEKFGNRFTPHGEPYAFWERCEAQHIPMPDKLILTVDSFPNTPRGIGLLLPATSSDPDGSENMVLVADTEGTPIPKPTHSPS